MIFSGVLTKPDRSPEAAHEKWVRFIKGETEPLHHGWFCVKLHDTQSGHPQPTLVHAREQEDQWFNKTSIWHGLPRQARNHLGTKKLVQSLEMILSDLIHSRYAMICIYSTLVVNVTPVEFQRSSSKSGTLKRELSMNWNGWASHRQLIALGRSTPSSTILFGILKGA